MTTVLFALEYMLEDKIEVVIVGDSSARDEMISELYGRFRPRMVLAVSDDSSEATPLFEGRGATQQK